jgi:hypothetical protein
LKKKKSKQQKLKLTQIQTTRRNFGQHQRLQNLLFQKQKLKLTQTKPRRFFCFLTIFKFWEKQNEEKETKVETKQPTSVGSVKDKYQPKSNVDSFKKTEPEVVKSTGDLKSKFENLSTKEEPSWKKKEPVQSKWKKPEPVQQQSEPEPEPEPQQEQEPEPVYEPEPEPEQEPEPEPEPVVEEKIKAPYSALKNIPEPVFDEPEPEPEPVYEEPEPEPEPVYEEPEVESNTYVAQYDFASEDPEELPFSEGDVLTVLETGDDWWKAELNGRIGLVPANYLEKL